MIQPMKPIFAQGRRMRRVAAAILLSACGMPPSAHAAERPLWEVGAGLVGLSLPNYRGSNARQAYVLPMPYLVYRGEVLKMDRDGLRGLLFDSERVEVNVSLNGSLPVNSDDDPLRQGMSDLDPTVELGPTLNVRLWQSSDRRKRIEARAPVRTAITVSSSPEQIGWLFSPNLLLEIRDPMGRTGWNFSVQGGPYFGDRDYNRHFHGVRPAEATASRPAYDAAGGYAGSQATVTLTRRFARAWLGGFVRYDTLAGAVIEDSPLVRRTDAVSAGLAVTWIIKESKRRVEAEE
jgi:outer membrane scaffolding protein for murein synthesis (MipA/OmpV family)